MSAAPNWKPAPALRSPEWLAYVRSLPSAESGQRPCVAHHLIGGRYSTLKTSDYLAFPLTDTEHKALHHWGWVEWESKNGNQAAHSAATLRQGIRDGVLVWKDRPTDWEDLTAQELEAEIQSGNLTLDKRAARYIAA